MLMDASTTLHLNQTIARTADDVYAFVHHPANLPKWAAGLSAGIRRDAGRWVADSPVGEVDVEFAEDNPFGVCDHVVTLPDGTSVLNPLRVLDDGPRCDVVFTLRRRDGVTDEAFEADRAAVVADLESLRRLLEP
ncbi:SRPBCC family protein [Angustibacter aerolatus]